MYRRDLLRGAVGLAAPARRTSAAGKNYLVYWGTYTVADPRYGGDPGYPGYGGDPSYGGNQFEPWIRRWDSQPLYGAQPQPQPRGGLFGWQQPPPQPRYDAPRGPRRGRNDDVFIERD